MIKEQLSAYKKKMKTIIHQKKHLITFIPEFNADNMDLLRNIELTSEYTNLRSLHFERQSLSMKEEIRFNHKFVSFLKSLIIHMNEKWINFLLEYLVRIYHVDTYNSEELLFLLLPFRRYSAEIVLLGKNNGNAFMFMNGYSISYISRVIVDNHRYFKMYCEYFRTYNLLKGFLDATMDEIVVVLSGGSHDYLGEMYDILSILLEDGHGSVAIDIYNRLCKYLKGQEFHDLLVKYTDKYDGIILNCENRLNSIDNQLEQIWRDNAGWDILNDSDMIRAYLRFVINKSKDRDSFKDKYITNKDDNNKNEIFVIDESNSPFKEFTGNEMKILFKIFLDDTIFIDFSQIHINEWARLYKHLKDNLSMTRWLISSNGFDSIFKHANDESVVFILNNFNLIKSSDKLKNIDQTKNLDVKTISDKNIIRKNMFEKITDDLLTDDNHSIVLRNIRNEILDEFYELLLFKCMKFVTFEPRFFQKYVKYPYIRNDVINRNIVALAVSCGYDLGKEITSADWGNGVFLDYILSSSNKYTWEETREIISNVKRLNEQSLIISANGFLVINYYEDIVLEFISWSANNLKNVEKLIESTIDKLLILVEKSAKTKITSVTFILSYDFLFNFLLETKNHKVLEKLVLYELNNNNFCYDNLYLENCNDTCKVSKYHDKLSIIQQLYDRKAFNLIYNIAELKLPVRYLIRHPQVLGFIEEYGEILTDKHTLVAFLLENAVDKQFLEYLIRYFDLLIEFRREKELWTVAKMLIMEGVDKTKTECVDKFVKYILENIEDFVGDSDLFDKLVSLTSISFDTSLVKELCSKNGPSIEFVNALILRDRVDLLGIIPFAVPPLIKQRQPAVSTIFVQHGVLLGEYAKMLIETSVTDAYLLVHIDPRCSLKVLIDFFNKEAISLIKKYLIKTKNLEKISNNNSENINESDDNSDRDLKRLFINLNENSFKNLEKISNNNSENINAIESAILEILKEKNTTSLFTIERMCTFLTSQATEMISQAFSEICKYFIEFYIRSFGKAANNSVSRLVEQIFINHLSIFSKLAAYDILAKNTSIFHATFRHALNEIYSNRTDDEIIQFFLDYLDLCLDAIAGENHLLLCKKIYMTQNSNSQRIIAMICRFNSNIIVDFNKFIEDMLNTDTDQASCIYGLNMLAYLHENIKEYAVNKISTRKLALLFSEDRNNDVADLSRNLYNILL